jgi:hypothetical protein
LAGDGSLARSRRELCGNQQAWAGMGVDSNITAARAGDFIALDGVCCMAHHVATGGRK